MNVEPKDPVDIAMETLLKSARGETVGEGRTVESSIEALEEHIGVLEHAFARLQTNMLRHIARSKSRRNALLAVSHLPNELFVDIATLFLKDLAAGTAFHQKLLTMMLVCKHWHGIVDSTPTLWSHLSPWPLCPVAYSSAAIIKSKSSSLNIYQPEGYPPTPYHPGERQRYASYIRLILPEVPRWACATINPDPLDAESLSQLEQHAPQLTSFSLTMSSWTTKELPSEPLNLFGGEASQLRNLELAHVPIPWTSSILSGLTSLKITFPKNRGPSTIEIIHVLQNCPGLAKLSLTGADSRATGQAMVYVELSQLTQVSLGGLKTDMTRSLLTSVSAPICRKLDLRCRLSERSSISTILPADQLLRSFPKLHQRLWESQTVHVSNPTQSDIGVSIKGDEDCCLELAFKSKNNMLSSTLEWLERIVPGLKEKSATVNFSWADFGDLEVLTALDERLDVEVLLTADSGEPEQAEDLLDYLAGPTDKDGILHWPFPNLVELSVMPEDIDPCSISEMVASRYGCDGAKNVPRRLPKPFKNLYIADPPSSKGFKGNIVEIVGNDVVTWGDDND